MHFDSGPFIVLLIIRLLELALYVVVPIVVAVWLKRRYWERVKQWYKDNNE